MNVVLSRASPIEMESNVNPINKHAVAPLSRSTNGRYQPQSPSEPGSNRRQEVSCSVDELRSESIPQDLVEIERRRGSHCNLVHVYNPVHNQFASIMKTTIRKHHEDNETSHSKSNWLCCRP